VVSTYLGNSSGRGGQKGKEKIGTSKGTCALKKRSENTDCIETWGVNNCRKRKGRGYGKCWGKKLREIQNNRQGKGKPERRGKKKVGEGGTG